MAESQLSKKLNGNSGKTALGGIVNKLLFVYLFLVMLSLLYKLFTFNQIFFEIPYPFLKQLLPDLLFQINADLLLVLTAFVAMILQLSRLKIAKQIALGSVLGILANILLNFIITVSQIGLGDYMNSLTMGFLIFEIPKWIGYSSLLLTLIFGIFLVIFMLRKSSIDQGENLLKINLLGFLLGLFFFLDYCLIYIISTMALKSI